LYLVVSGRLNIHFITLLQTIRNVVATLFKKTSIAKIVIFEHKKAETRNTVTKSIMDSLHERNKMHRPI